MKITVTEDDIRSGIAGDCLRCAVAKALQRRTKDDCAKVVEAYWNLRLEVWSRSIVAPIEVQDFILEFDQQERDEARHLILPGPLPPKLAPFSFEIPNSDDPEWLEECCKCQELKSPSELDGEGYCKECRE